MEACQSWAIDHTKAASNRELKASRNNGIHKGIRSCTVDRFLLSSSLFTFTQSSYVLPPYQLTHFSSLHEPKPVIHSHLTNGPSPLSGSTEARDKIERDTLYAQIQNSNRGRQAVNFDEPNGHFPKSSTNGYLDDSNGRERHQIVQSEIDMEGYNEGGPTSTPLATSRARSPYTQHPTIDVDGLSWPSR